MNPLLAEAREWARGRSWIPRALLLAYLVWCEWRLLHDPESSTIFAGITLAFHEMGHLLTSFLPHLICAAAGSGMQVLIPVVVIIVFRRQDDYFGMSVGGFWLSFSLFDVARYVGDARAMELPLVGFVQDPKHDWHYILGTLHLLPADHFLAFMLRVFATLAGIASLAFAVWLLNEMGAPKPSLLAPGEVGAKRRMRGGRRGGTGAQAGGPERRAPHPAFGHPLPPGEGQSSNAVEKWDDLTKPD